MSIAVRLGHRLLSNSICYNSFQNLVGSVALRNEIVNQTLKDSKTKDVIDLGSGTGATIPHLTEQHKYLGLDNSREYLSKARKVKTKGDVTLQLCDLNQVGWGDLLQDYSQPLILGLGIFHHLDDRALNNTLSELSKNVAPGSVLYALDPIVVESSTHLASWFARNDRGRYLRSEEYIGNLFAKHGWTTTFKVSKNRLRIPYDVIESSGYFVG